MSSRRELGSALRGIIVTQPVPCPNRPRIEAACAIIAETAKSYEVGMAAKAVHLAEYDALKAEQRQRIQTRDHLIYFNILAIGTVFSLMAKLPAAGDAILLIVPWIGICLGWIHVVNDQKIVEIRQYLEKALKPALEKETAEEALLQWESGTWRPFWISKRRSYSLIKFFAFLAPGVLAVGWYMASFGWTGQKPLSPTLFLALIEAFFLVMLGFWLDRDFGYRSEETRQIVAERDLDQAQAGKPGHTTD